MADKIIQLHDELGNNIYPITTIDALYGSGALANVFVDKKGDTMTGNLTAPKFIGSLQGNADSSSKVNNSLSIQLNGGTATTFNGSAAKSINITPAAIGAAAASHGTHVTYSTTTPVMDGTASVGSAVTVARSDHKHPTDTSRAAVSDLTSHTGNTTIHITATERTNWNAAKTHADSAHAPSNAEKNQNAFSNIVVGSTTISADTVTDSLTLVGSNVTLTSDATNDKITIGITKENVTTALGYTPPTTNTTYGSMSIDEGTTGTATTSRVLTAANLKGIINAHAPTKTGSGASGTWGISITGNASTATKLATARTISLTGAVTGSGSFDGSGNLSISTTTNHSHSYLPLSGGTMTGSLKSSYVGGGMWIAGTHDASFVAAAATTAAAGQYYQGWFSGKTQSGAWSLGALSGSEDLYFVYGTDADYNSNTNTTAQTRISSTGQVYGAVWNDYAEFRICKDEFKPGQVVLENGDDTLSIASQRLQRGCSIVSDTFGFAIGETDEAKCPIAVSGRVLAYGYESREEFKKHIGWPVCSGPNGTVSIMTEEEEEKYPSRIIGTISAVPDYETWGTGNVEVNNRIWIKIK